MIGNTNAIIKAGSGNNIEFNILNAVLAGSLTREKNVFSNFSSSNYIKIPKYNRVTDDKILNIQLLSQSRNSTDLGTADSFEIVVKIKSTQIVTSGRNPIFGQETSNYTPQLELNLNTNTINFVYSVNGSSWTYNINGTYQLAVNTWYYIKYFYTGTKIGYVLYDEAMTELETIERDETRKTYTGTIVFTLGKDDDSGFKGEIDLEGIYIKLNNQMWWKPVYKLQFDEINSYI